MRRELDENILKINNVLEVAKFEDKVLDLTQKVDHLRNMQDSFDFEQKFLLSKLVSRKEMEQSIFKALFDLLDEVIVQNVGDEMDKNLTLPS